MGCALLMSCMITYEMEEQLVGQTVMPGRLVGDERARHKVR